MAGSNETSKSNGGQARVEGRIEDEDNDEKAFKVSDRRFWASEGHEETARTEGNGDPTPAYPSYVEELRAALADKDKQLREHLANFQEQVAEGIEATKVRLERENQREIERLRGQVVAELLDVLDNLDRSLEAARQTENFHALVEGLKLVANQFSTKLQGLGLERFEVLGQPFDPKLHEAIGTVEVTDAGQDGRIVREVKAGYRLGEKVLRPALVQVGKRPGT